MHMGFVVLLCGLYHSSYVIRVIYIPTFLKEVSMALAKVGINLTTKTNKQNQNKEQVRMATTLKGYIFKLLI